MKRMRAPEVGPAGLEQRSNGIFRFSWMPGLILTAALTSLESRGRLCKGRKATREKIRSKRFGILIGKAETKSGKAFSSA